MQGIQHKIANRNVIRINYLTNILNLSMQIWGSITVYQNIETKNIDPIYEREWELAKLMINIRVGFIIIFFLFAFIVFFMRIHKLYMERSLVQREIKLKA